MDALRNFNAANNGLSAAGSSAAASMATRLSAMCSSRLEEWNAPDFLADLKETNSAESALRAAPIRSAAGSAGLAARSRRASSGWQTAQQACSKMRLAMCALGPNRDLYTSSG